MDTHEGLRLDWVETAAAIAAASTIEELRELSRGGGHRSSDIDRRYQRRIAEIEAARRQAADADEPVDCPDCRAKMAHMVPTSVTASAVRQGYGCDACYAATSPYTAPGEVAAAERIILTRLQCAGGVPVIVTDLTTESLYSGLAAYEPGSIDAELQVVRATLQVGQTAWRLALYRLRDIERTIIEESLPDEDMPQYPLVAYRLASAS